MQPASEWSLVYALAEHDLKEGSSIGDSAIELSSSPTGVVHASAVAGMPQAPQRADVRTPVSASAYPKRRSAASVVRVESVGR
jgi:hypothetical protein